MSENLPRILSSILSYYGAVVSLEEKGQMEYLAPQEMAKNLGIPEYGVLNCLPQPAPETIAAFYDSEFIRSLDQFLADKGKIVKTVFSASIPNVNKLSHMVTHTMGFSNAVFRVREMIPRDMVYLCIFFKYTALSDDKQEDLISVLMNPLNASVSLIHDHDFYLLEGLKEAEADYPWVLAEMTSHIEAAYSFAKTAIREKMGDFINNLEKRLNRDTKRVYEYYETLRQETNRSMAKLEKNVQELDKLRDKIKAIDAEEKWKIKDLIAKYKLEINIKPFSLIAIQTQSACWNIEIKRRAKTRSFLVSFNPLLRHIDPLPCEACFYPRRPYYVCDDRLHIVCQRCWGSCSSCLKSYCLACHPRHCPKCGK